MLQYYFISFSVSLDWELSFGNFSAEFQFTPNLADLMEAVVLAYPDREVAQICILGFTKFDSEEHKNYFYTERPGNEIDITVE